ncbi:hypothetical protein [Leptospira noguchii]|uniref:Uncharacterized protein n=1 Tax=Leptospira noguchii TaxID=28182 RepID=A0AAE9K9I9_9LEPT|nr:hypothetical protein [Leptospira noguchii]UOG32011.1 hypothetical protein MAL06_08625 [Leptospira noguchii]UOG54233.1 hypothetical protein MAL09_09275 [Leptospira noguchii]UOG58110.1 hypothetical protein MAL03_08490 [Leptospira noguchii]
MKGFLKALETQRLASTVARQVMSHFKYEICELQHTSKKLCIEFFIRPDFLTPNSR